MTILILKDVREKLQVDLQSAKLHEFMAITQPFGYKFGGVIHMACDALDQ